MQDTFSSTSAGPGPVFWVVWLALVVLEIAAMWRVFTKAGQPGWAAIIPIYNAIVLLQIAGKPIWWIILFLIPIVNIIVAVMMWHGVSKSYGKGAGFTVGLILLGFIFIPILAWGDAEYLGPTAGTPAPA